MQLGQEVPVGKIHQELKKLWASNDAATKASLMNFAIYSESPGSLEENTALISKITEEHACRALVIFARQDSEAMEARAWITAHCRLAGGKKAVCSEQIAFDLHGQCANLVRNIVFANLESDLPLVVWWQGDLTDRFDERFFSRIDRLVVDSATWDDPAAQFGMVLSASKESGQRFLLNDLSWTRSYDLRLSLASLFDHADLLKGLPEIETIRISHGKNERVCAAMVLVWMANMLQLENAARTGNSFILQKPDGSKIDASLDVTDAEVALPRLSMEGKDMSLIFELDADARFWHATANCSGNRIHQMFPAHDQALPNQINAQLQRARENSLFKQITMRLEAWL
ncbi:MAG: glucose-6-phosphate dehydrogenase assembly protein OpcA [Verrucomicrobiota bacterium]